MYSNVGFYKAPVSKTLMVYIGCSHAATHIPSLSPFFKRIFAEPFVTESPKSFLRLLGSKFLFPDTRSTILVCFLIYFFRVLERRTGSLKFSSNLSTCWLLGMSFDVLLHSILDSNDVTWSPFLTPGPLSLILPLFIPYYQHVPLTTGSHMGPFSISTKSMTYVLGLQLIASSTSSLISSVLYMCIGASVYCTTLSSVRLPSCLGSICSSLTSWLHSSPPPTSSQPMGATLEIQRTQHAEAVEQQLLRARARQFNVGGRQMRLDEMWGQGRNNRPAPAAPVQPSPGMVQALMDMGFSRQRVEQALIRSGNNLPEATNILLNDI